MIAQGHARFDRHRTHGGASIFHGMATRAGNAELADEAQRHVLGADVRSESAFEADPHALRALERHRLGGEDVRELARSAPEGERANPAHGAGMAVGHGMGRAGQHHAELGRDHMRDPLLGIGDVEQADAMAAAAFAHGL
jgi:hypothetical protein